MRIFGSLLIILVGAFLSNAIVAQQARRETPAPQASPLRSKLLVSTAWLGRHLNDPDLVILYAGDVSSYARHIPGARRVALNDISVSSPGATLELPSPEELRTRLSRLGITDKSRIIVYYGPDSAASATRVIFTLDAAGLGARTFLLDGGLEAWQRENRPLTTAAPRPVTGKLSALRMKPAVVDAAFVQQNGRKSGYALIDARAPSYFYGIQTGSSHHDVSHKRGHIPGARNIDFSILTDSDGRVRSTADLAAAFARAGVKRGDTLIIYCHIGQQATAIAFAARMLGYRTLLYDGAFEDWSRRDLPVELLRS